MTFTVPIWVLWAFAIGPLIVTVGVLLLFAVLFWYHFIWGVWGRK